MLTPMSPSSLSVKNHASHDLILDELHRLEASINEALHVSSRPIGGFLRTVDGPSSARVAGNLRQLAEAARQFHTAASSTAGTVRGDRSEAPWQSYPGADISLFGDFPTSRREGVEEFLRRLNTGSPEPFQRITRPSTPRSSEHRAPYPASTFCLEMPSSNPIVVEEDEEDAELERSFREGLKQLTTASFQDENYDRAIRCLRQALTHGVVPGQSGDDHVQLQLQLALCYFLVGKWQLAAPLVSKVAGSTARPDLALCNLLHALALGYLSTPSSKGALATCRQALKGKKRLINSGDIEPFEYWETLGLFVTIFDATDDSIQAEVFRLQLPPSFVYLHPVSEVAFVRACPGLLKSIFGIDIVVHGNGHPGGLMSELEGGSVGDGPAQLLADIGGPSVDAHSPNDGDDEISAASTPSQSPIRSRLGWFFGLRRPWSNDTGDWLAGSSRRKDVPESLPAASAQMELRHFADGSSLPIIAPMNLLTKKPPTHKRLLPKPDSFAPSAPRGTFTLLRMERTPTPTSRRPHGLSLREETSRTDKHTSKEQAQSQPNDDVNVLGSSRFPAELPDTSVSAQAVRECNIETNLDILRPYPGIRITSDACSSNERIRYIPDSPVVPRKTIATSSISRPVSPKKGRSFPETPPMRPPPGNSTPAPADTETYPRNHTHVSASRSINDLPKSLKQLSSRCLSAAQTPIVGSPVIPTELDKLVTQLSATMASLSGSNNPFRLRANLLTLRTLLPRLRLLGNDQLLLGDVESVIRDLEARTRPMESSRADSGYESLGSSNERPAIA